MIKSRKIANVIAKWLDEKEIIILTGVRQVGKTSLLQLLSEKIKERKVPEKNVVYLSLEDINVLSTLNENPENIFSYAINRDQKNYFLIDEIQYLDNPSNFLKLLFDKYSDQIKLIVTGSSSLELKANFQDSLAGRKVTFEILPLDFEEFLQFKNFSEIDFFDRKDLPIDIKRKFDNVLEEYLLYGGMPAVVLKGEHGMKVKLLEEYVSAYINKDIRAIGKIDNISSFNNLIRALAIQIGRLINVNELSNTLGIARREVEKFIELLEYTFVLYKAMPFSVNVRSQITKMPKIYFFDTGIRNAILGNFTATKERNDSGALFENFIFMELKKRLSKNPMFFRKISGSEIDFVVEKGNKLFPIEVKFKQLMKKIDERVIENFVLDAKKEGCAYVVNLSLNNESRAVKYIDYRFINKI